jgi:hypothetical protein
LDLDEQIGTDEGCEKNDGNKKHKCKATKSKDEAHDEDNDHARKP